MRYEMDKVRNIALMGHSSAGKTSLAESMLYVAGATDRLGKVTDKNTVSDFDSEEVKRQISIYLSTMYCEYKKCKINILDVPGFFDFAGESVEAMRAVDGGIIVVSAKDGISVGAEKAWKMLSEKKLPRGFYVSRVDEEHASFEDTFKALHDKYGSAVCPLMAPIKGASGKAEGYVDLITKKGYEVKNGKAVERAIPADMADELEELYMAIAEAVAETDEELMEKYFEGEEFTTEEIINGLKIGLHDHSLFPVFCGSPVSNLGTASLLDAIVDLFPAPGEAKKEYDVDGEEIVIDPNGSTVLIVYKNMLDQYGKMSQFKVIRGKLTPDMSLLNPRTGSQEKMGHIYYIQGKKTLEVQEIGCGDIGAVSKLTATKTGDTLCDPKNPITAEGLTFAEPCYTMAIAPAVKGQDDKMASGLNRLNEEDLSFSVYNNAETHQMLISGAGDIQIDVLCTKLKEKYGVAVTLSPERIAYREKIRKTVDAHGRHKKQTGGHGQFGDVKIRFEPQSESEDLIFEEQVFGGSVPKNFFPAVEKGLRESVLKGVLAGYPMVYLKAVLYDGSYHPVDSSEMAFKTAASLAFKDGIPKGSPVILEPIGYLTVTIPDNNLGDIMSDLSKRRGSPMGMNANSDGMQVVEAEVPMGEMSGYAIDLRSMTQGRGSFSLKFVRYDEAPAATQAKIIAEAKAAEDDD